jgi:hypothetical protein
MRAFALAVCVWVLTANGAAMAAECTKGMLWPYVRNPGDCLTDEEIRAGQKGAYSGPVNTNPDVANIKVVTPPQNSVGGGGSSGGGLLDKLDLPTFSTTGDSTATYDSLGPAGVIRRSNTAPATACNKGYLWPFYRSPGDCLTDEEKAQGRNGVYRAEEYVAPTPVSATASAANSNAGAANEPPPAPACHKGLLWPFVRSAGDCPTDAEKAEASKGR